MDSIKLLVLEELLRKDPESRVFLRLAEELRKEGQYERAIEVCKAGLPKHQGYVPAMVSLGRSCQALGRKQEAEAVFEEVLVLAPDNTHALRGLGHLLAERGEAGKALEHWERLQLYEPNDEEAQQQIADLKSRNGLAEPEPMVQDYELIPDEGAAPALIEPDPVFEVDEEGDAEPQFEPAPQPSPEPEFRNAEEKAGELDDSMANLDREFEKALDEEPDDPDLFLDSEALTEELDVKTIQREVKYRKSPPEAEFDEWVTRGLKHEKMEHLEEALGIYQDLLERYPDHTVVQEHLERVKQLTKNESLQAKKIRILSNWLDKIKGVYHVS